MSSILVSSSLSSSLIFKLSYSSPRQPPFHHHGLVTVVVVVVFLPMKVVGHFSPLRHEGGAIRQHDFDRIAFTARKQESYRVGCVVIVASSSSSSSSLPLLRPSLLIFILRLSLCRRRRVVVGAFSFFFLSFLASLLLPTARCRVLVVIGCGFRL